ncbi:MAE_28990/MAE_18760 family HEPN-like nuclease [Marinobacterium lacunae]|uniref:MAE_28990/MAE_18760 family HEPN-like nuclease n=1 Tax=Marinobacterium lacunae TaxID=1232683 RepID=UPI000566D58D|nr:MAE_28990/MAE_18760 family HEPN-like nuclease [Marinobacterium lacunae]
MSSYAETLENDLSWREAELVSLKRLTINNDNNEVVYRAMLRACWALLYAHFEGFTKFTWDLLLDHIQERNIKICNLSEKFKILALTEAFNGIRQNSSSENIMSFINSVLPTLMEKAARFDNAKLETSSNLWPNVFREECEKIGIRSEELENNTVRIKALVSRRNDIAHGKKMIIRSINEYNEYERATLLVMHDLAVNIIEIIESSKFKI